MPPLRIAPQEGNATISFQIITANNVSFDGTVERQVRLNSLPLTATGTYQCCSLAVTHAIALLYFGL